jgi:hypothetical protein
LLEPGVDAKQGTLDDPGGQAQEPPEQSGARPRRSSHLGTQLAYGGVDFELLTDFDGWELPEKYQPFVTGVGTMPSVAQVRCAVSADPALCEESAFRTPIHADWQRSDHAFVQTGRMRAELTRLAPRSYAVTVRTSPDSHGITSLLTALGATVVNREGGLVVHATSVLLHGRAILFIGPSGAGKSTAAGLCSEAELLAPDRTVVFPARDGWRACGLAGGKVAADAPSRTAQVQAPLGGILRVRHASEAPALDRLSPSAGLATVRESVLASQGDSEGEERLFSTISRITERAPVGEVYTRLGVSMDSLLTNWLDRGAP